MNTSLMTLSAVSRNLDVASLTVRRRMTSLGIQPAAVLANGCVLLDEDAVARLRASIAPTQQSAEPIMPAAMVHTEPGVIC